ncbi:MAG: hypothetical protein LBT00_14015 [Spirochaetaceae bacterium]|nr:hypothetical protein [Spirochaetaceae bacterium]
MTLYFTVLPGLLRRFAARNDGGVAGQVAGIVIANPKGEAIQTRGVLPGLLRFARNDGWVTGAMTGGVVIARA